MLWIVVLGIATGARSMTAMAVVCWFGYLQLLPLHGTWAFWVGNIISAIIFTVLAVGEYVGDTLPRIPAAHRFRAAGRALPVRWAGGCSGRDGVDGTPGGRRHSGFGGRYDRRLWWNPLASQSHRAVWSRRFGGALGVGAYAGAERAGGVAAAHGCRVGGEPGRANVSLEADSRE